VNPLFLPKAGWPQWWFGEAGLPQQKSGEAGLPRRSLGEGGGIFSLSKYTVNLSFTLQWCHLVNHESNAIFIYFLP
jgi:hypothetical protein